MSTTDLARPRFARMYVKAVNPSDCSSRPPTTAACGRGSSVAAIPRVTEAAIGRAGFELQSSERLMFAAARFEPAIPYVLGTGRRGS